MTDRFRIVIAGGGIAAVEAALALAELSGGDRLQVLLLTSTREFVFQALEDDGAPASRLERIPLRAVATTAGAELVDDVLLEVLPESRRVATRRSGALGYDALIIAVGARAWMAVNGAVQVDSRLHLPAADRSLALVSQGWARRPAIVVPDHAVWSLPAYELALHAARDAPAEPTVVTVETCPAEVFGSPAIWRVREVLADAGVRVVTRSRVEEHAAGALRLTDGGEVAADQVLSLPSLHGPRVAGLPCDAHGFLEVDAVGAVAGTPGVWAAGDATARPVKQGGLAAQQAARAAAEVARAAGLDPQPPDVPNVLRGVLPTGDATLFLERDLGERGSKVSSEPLWHPPGRVAGIRLSRLAPQSASAASRA